MIVFIRRHYLSLLLFLLTLILYIHNASRSVYGGDVGDLVTAAFVGGVPHPPGYPLFSLLGFLMTRFTDLFQQTPAFMVGLTSVFSSAGAVVLFFLSSKKLTKNTVVSLIGALVLAFSYLFWFYAEIAEVFALNTFFAFLLVYLALCFRESKNIRTLFALSFFTGLSLTNHQTIIFLFPAVAILIAQPFFTLVKKKKRLLLSCAGFLLLGFSVYAYVIFASLRHPVIDWAHITDLSSFFDLILRKRYGTFQAGNFAPPPLTARAVILKYYFLTLISQLTIPVVLLCILGGTILFLKKRTIALALFLGFLLSGPLFIAYAGFPLSDSYRFGVYERFLSLSASFVLLFLPLGILSLSTFLGKFFTRKVFVLLFQLIFLLTPLQLFIYNFPKTNLSNVWDGDIFGYDELKVLPQNSVLFLSGDTNLFNTWYIRYARGFRKDVMVLNPLAPDTTNITLSQHFPDMKVAGDSAGQSIHNLSSNVATINKTNPVISDLQMVGPEGNFAWVPSGMNYRLLHPGEGKPDDAAYKKESQKIWESYTLPKMPLTSPVHGSYTISDLPMYYANGMLMTGNYFNDTLHDAAEAEKYYQKALHLVPDYEKAMIALGVFYWTQKHDCGKGIPYLEKAIATDPTDSRFYDLLYIAYQTCSVSKQKQQSLLTHYAQQFGSSLTADLKKRYENDKNKK